MIIHRAAEWFHLEEVEVFGPGCRIPAPKLTHYSGKVDC